MSEKQKRFLQKLSTKWYKLTHPKIFDYHNCGLYQHAVRELDLAGWVTTSDKWASGIRKCVLKLIGELCAQDYSGTSADTVIKLFKKLAAYNVLTPLTLNDDEFIEITPGVFQNIRKTTVFKENGKIHDIGAYVKVEVAKKYYDSKEIEKPENPLCWQGGGVYECENGIATGRWFLNCYIKSDSIYIPKDPIKIPVTGVEINPDDWWMFAEKSAIKESGIEKQFKVQWKKDKDIKGYVVK